MLHPFLLGTVTAAWILLFSVNFLLYFRSRSKNIKVVRIHSGWKKFYVSSLIGGVLFLLMWKIEPTQRMLLDKHLLGILYVLGEVAMLTGFITALIGRIQLGHHWSPLPVMMEGAVPIQDGVFKLLKHPIYSGLSLMLVGTLLVTQLIILAPVIVVAIVIFTGKAHMEEVVLREFQNPS
jgi:protein-S-isoprenylcysteine O-methyltransferase Ste14